MTIHGNGVEGFHTFIYAWFE